MKKRIQSFFLAAVTAVFVGACGDDPDVSDASENKSSTKPAGAYSTISFQNEKIASQAYQQCAEMSYLFDRKIADFENELIFFANSLQFLVKVNSKPIPSPDIVYHENYLDAKKAPLTFSLFKPYGFSVDFEHICCRLPKDMKVADAEKRASDVASLFPQIKEIMANSHFGAEKDRNTNAAIERFKKEGAPVVLVFLAFRDGLYFCYPGKTYKDDYDPCARGWYKGRIGQDSPRAGWSEPYVNANQSDTVITYTVRLDDAVRKP